jgi:hypothetical protein
MPSNHLSTGFGLTKQDVDKFGRFGKSVTAIHKQMMAMYDRLPDNATELEKTTRAPPSQLLIFAVFYFRRTY